MQAGDIKLLKHTEFVSKKATERTKYSLLKDSDHGQGKETRGSNLNSSD